MPPTPTNGKICYLEMPARDVERSADFYGALDRTRRPAAGCDQQRLPKAIGPASASVSGTVAS
jgi:hypothetical protein